MPVNWIMAGKQRGQDHRGTGGNQGDCAAAGGAVGGLLLVDPGIAQHDRDVAARLPVAGLVVLDADGQGLPLVDAGRAQDVHLSPPGQRHVQERAEELKRRALRNDFDALAIIAPPKALGVLRKELNKEVERRVVLTLNKEMTDRPIPDIEELLAGEAAPPA